ncbi:GAF domain-containing protein [Streptomyces mexicanus]
MFGHEGGAAPQEGARALDHEVGRLAQAGSAHVVAAYLDVPEDRLIRMTVVTGVPARIARPWSRVARAAPVPVAEAVRTGRPVWIGSHQELARRFPRTALAFPYPIAMYVAPLVEGGTCWGAVLLLWPGTRPPTLGPDEERAIDDACRRMARGLRRSAERESRCGRGLNRWRWNRRRHRATIRPSMSWTAFPAACADSTWTGV